MAVHPRACGERLSPGLILGSLSGSSPRMRGTLGGAYPNECRVRFIPAHAGNADISDRPPAPSSVHPRACGERFGVIVVGPAVPGSSPRMRATRVSSHMIAMTRRFIPAHAGNAAPDENAASRCPVHPRACGERAKAMAMPIVTVGSCPRMRGTLAVSAASGQLRRFIPAHAGNAAACRGVGL